MNWKRWVAGLVGVGMLASMAAPLFYEQLHVDPSLRPGAQVLTPEIERQLSCSVEAACGPLRQAGTLVLVGTPELLPTGTFPPGYAECAAAQLGTAFGEQIELTPCEKVLP